MLAVTGSTGRLGGRVASRLAQTGRDQRLLVRDPSRAPDLRGAEIRQAVYDDTDAVAAALSGVETVLMVSAAEHPNRVAQHRCFIDGAVGAGVGQLVYTSFVGADAAAMFTLGRDHHRTEEYIRASGLSYTFLRDNLYADFFPMMVGPDGVIRGPAGDGRVAAVAQDDIAEAAVSVLSDPPAHAGAVYHLSGPEALTLTEVAATISEGTGRPVSFHDETVAEAYASRASYFAPQWQLDAWVSTYTAIAAGEFAGVSSDIETLTGHPATPLAEVVRRQAG
ncbi:MAG TPA: SDR family oxidoreductase [Microlunatus sp.]